ncbi:hypothetical protein EDB85DRAFT_1870274, partial [Lactarius pseudohatsudake]
VKLYSTMDNFITKNTEQLHIDLAKDAYATTNHKDEFSQMTTWLECKEKIHWHNCLVQWQLEGSPIVAAPHEWLLPRLELDCKLHMAKHLSTQNVSLDALETKYSAEHFCTALQCYIVISNLPHPTTAQVEHSLWDVHFPFRHLPVWHRIKYLCTEPYTGLTQTVDSIHAYPHRFDVLGHRIPCRFDMALINEGHGGDTGAIGESFRHHIGCVCIVFSLPEKSLPTLFLIGNEVPKHLVYIEWYTSFTENLEPGSHLFKISPMKDRGGGRVCSIIPLANIHRSVDLIPKFGMVAPQEWMSSTVLDSANVFFVNSFTDSHLYCIIC